MYDRDATLRNLVRCLFLISIVILVGCETTNSIPYKASTANVIAIQQNLDKDSTKVSLGTISMAPGVEESPLCRLMGPVVVAPGKTLSQYIKDAFLEELFMAQVYSADAPATISGQITDLSFSSVAPANWQITMQVSSNNSPGYSVATKYAFNTSWTAYSACQNVADAFGPAVQDLLKKVVTHPQFAALTQ